MKLIQNNLTQMSGIYQINNIINNKKYYGSSVDINKRFKEHLRTLKTNTHKNMHLQNACNLYSIEIFEMKPIEYVEDLDKLSGREQEYLDLYWDGGINCYNIEKYVGAPMRGRLHTEIAKNKMSISRTGKIASAETRKLFSEIHMGEKNSFFGKIHNETSKLLISEANKGENNGMYGKRGSLSPLYQQFVSDETRKKLSLAGKGKQSGENNPMFGVKGLDHPSTKIFNVNLKNQITNEIIYGPINGISQLAKKLGINNSYFGEFLKGKRKVCKNWIILNEIEANESPFLSKQ